MDSWALQVWGVTGIQGRAQPSCTIQLLPLKSASHRLASEVAFLSPDAMLTTNPIKIGQIKIVEFIFPQEAS